MTTTQNLSSVFATSKTSVEDLQALHDVALPLMVASGGIVKWGVIEKATGIGYSRGWLIARRWYLEQNAPATLIDMDKLIAAKQSATIDFDAAVRLVASPMIQAMYDDQKLSWGEIMVRLGWTEGRVRKTYEATGAKKTLGLRTGKGGNFAYRDGSLYTEHRVKEGAQIPVTLKRRPVVEDLLNATKPEPAAKPVKATKPVKQTKAS